MKRVLTGSLVFLYLLFAFTLNAQNLIENEDIQVTIPDELKPFKNVDNKGGWAFIHNALSYRVDEMKSKESDGEFLSGWAKHIGNGNHVYLNSKIDGYYLSEVIFETTPDGNLYNNELIAFDNVLHKSVYKNAAKIYSFLISYPKKDSLSYAPLIQKIKNSIYIKHRTYLLTPSDNKDSITLLAPCVSFVDVSGESCGLHTSFLQQLIFRKSSTDIESAIKEKTAFYKRTGTKGIALTERNINGIQAFILKGTGKNPYHKGLCSFETCYFFQMGNHTWEVEYTLSQDCKEPVEEERYKKIIESIRYYPNK